MSSQVIRMESPRRFVARCATESMKKCFLSCLATRTCLRGRHRWGKRMRTLSSTKLLSRYNVIRKVYGWHIFSVIRLSLDGISRILVRGIKIFIVVFFLWWETPLWHNFNSSFPWLTLELGCLPPTLRVPPPGTEAH